jgi:hypothetical protein
MGRDRRRPRRGMGGDPAMTGDAFAALLAWASGTAAATIIVGLFALWLRGRR